MRPCANCIYIRFALCIFILAALMLYLKLKFIKMLSFTLFTLSLYIGFKYSYVLNENYKAVKEANPFGISFCPSSVSAFNIALDKIHFFHASGSCGKDKPLVDEDIKLSKIQEFFIGKKEDNFSSGLYSNGWFLLPSFEFINMAQAAFLVFLALFILCLKEFISFLKNKIYAFTSLILGFCLIQFSTL